MRLRLACAAVLALGACSREAPEPAADPPIDRAAYEKQHQAWLAEQRSGLAYVLPIAGIWPLPEGETAFGADPALPVALPPAHFPARAGVFRRAGEAVTIVPARPGTLRLDDGGTLDAPAAADAVTAGPIRLEITNAGDARRWVTAIDTAHPAATNPPGVPSYPLDPRWRVAAVFHAFDDPRPVRVPDVRGGFMNFMAVGELAFELDGRAMRLTAFGEEGRDELFVMFRDPTNQETTYSGYRILLPVAPADGGTTVLDFNFATNPPCAYSRFTTCPLPPPENRLPVAIEAGLQRLPSAEGFAAP